jgi:hypothetical protein
MKIGDLSIVFFQSGWAKNLPATLYLNFSAWLMKNILFDHKVTKL